MKTKPLTLAIVLVAVLLLAVVLNPSPERHRARIKETIGERSPVSRLLGLGSLAAFATSCHSLGVASYTTAGDRTLSFGVLGMVFVTQ
ncbi:hypothetical protein JJB11_19380 [Ramlibacter ginsenosidimutans]|uniref:Uncharacterized protein n=1 Tax=Ramlibacter ginsenosidimutans TaxID=502333 RepID=A0A934TVQ0_9BURK|nr:hypothetical protein [Ramlibacter ginsenosidimutans]MBK6008273.1 hypothetical protein [Ramlibacter ginsenosidimutans]